MQHCTRCSTDLPASEFWKGTNRNGLQNWCKECVKAHQRSATGRRQQRNQWYKSNYGITLAEFEAMEAKQGGVCAVCASTSGASTNTGQGAEMKLSVDHDHEAGTVRALLCQPCNLALGIAKDDPARLRALADYLEEWTVP